jgi:MFS family permease
MIPLLIGMVISNITAGLWIAHIGRYKAFAIVGFGLALVGFGMLAVFGPATPYVALGGCLAILGVGIGMIFPTLTLSYQSAVEFSELGVATSLNQFCRSMGSTLGSAVFGSILVLRFTTGLRNGLPPAVGDWLDSPVGAGLRDPQSVLNPDATAALREQLAVAFPNLPDVADQVLLSIQDSLGGALHLVFFIGAVIMACGLIGSLIWREIPMRTTHSAPARRSPAAAPLESRG